MGFATGKSPEQAAQEVLLDEAQKIMQKSAEAAKKLLPEAERQRDEAQKRAAELQARVTQLYTVVSFAQPYTAVSTGVTGIATGVVTGISTGLSTSSTVISSGNQALVINHPITAMTAVDKITSVLAARKEPLTTRALMDGLERQFGQPMPQSTVYAALSLGKKQGKFTDINGSWTIPQSELLK